MVAAAAAVSLSIARAGTQPSQKGPAEYFTGSVRIDPLFQAKDSRRSDLATWSGSRRASGTGMAPHPRPR
jgi:hypothetical protein